MGKHRPPYRWCLNYITRSLEHTVLAETGCYKRYVSFFVDLSELLELQPSLDLLAVAERRLRTDPIATP